MRLVWRSFCLFYFFLNILGLMDLCMVHCTVEMPTTDMHRSTFPGI